MTAGGIRQVGRAAAGELQRVEDPVEQWFLADAIGQGCLPL
jgi:hypothetical protein